MMTRDESGLIGRRCARLVRIHHRLGGRVDMTRGPLEIEWDCGDITLIDANTDWTLRVSSERWIDPFAGRSPRELAILEHEVGLWLRFDVEDEDPLAPLVGRRLSWVEDQHNEVGELVGLMFDFEELRM